MHEYLGFSLLPNKDTKDCWTNQESQRVDLEMFLLGAKIFFVHIKIAKFKHEFESHFGLKFTFLVCILRFPGFEPKANKNPEM